ncbi:MAG: DUF512 domain-containing protein [Lachnospiraceae bacterium]|nr:DUF512 domain-containing protein [Candidatus Minthocola equi]
MKKGQIIDAVEPGSIASELELLPGDELLEINGQIVEDVLDYRYLCNDEYLTLHIRRGEEEAEFEVEKDADEDLGLIFSNGLMDDYRSCSNRCIFCFVDQMPCGMRDTLYFKDDDARLSFLQGNYITMTNLSEHDVEKIINYRLSPINISVHTMNPELRVRMLHNKYAGESLKIIDRFYEAGLTMNGQIVMCEGFNDGDELEYTIGELAKYAPVMQSLSVVPVGLTKYREKLEHLEPISVSCANKTIDTIERFQKEIYDRCGIHFVHASDEFYLMTGRPIPEADRYDGYLQFENGVGMVRQLSDSFLDALETTDEKNLSGDIRIATGLLAAQTMQRLMDKMHEQFPELNIEVVPVINHFFGENITVAGLITGQDLTEQLKNLPNCKLTFIPSSMLRSGENVFLDDLTVEEAESILDTQIISTECDGYELFDTIVQAIKTLK